MIIILLIFLCLLIISSIGGGLYYYYYIYLEDYNYIAPYTESDVLKTDGDIPGFNIKRPENLDQDIELKSTFNNISMLDCFNKCKNSNLCSWANFDKSTNTCYLKQGDPFYDLSNKNDLDNNVTYFYDREKDEWSSKLNALTVSGFDINKIDNINSFTECRRYCKKDPRCSIISYKPNICWLKSTQLNPNIITIFK